MTLRELEKRISSLETQVAELRSLLKERPRDGKDWRRAVEKYAGDEGLLEVFAEAAKLREADRRRAGRTPSKRRDFKK